MSKVSGHAAIEPHRTSDRGLRHLIRTESAPVNVKLYNSGKVTAVLVRLSPVNLTEAQVVTVAVALAGPAGQPDAADGRVTLEKGWDVMGTVVPSVPSWSVWASK